MTDPEILDNIDKRLAAAKPHDAAEVTPEELDRTVKHVRDNLDRHCRIPFRIVKGEPAPTDLDRFRALFDSVGVKYDEDVSGRGSILTLEQNTGCSDGSMFLVWFDKDGKHVGS